jgi:hypothetical protein
MTSEVMATTHWWGDALSMTTARSTSPQSTAAQPTAAAPAPAPAGKIRKTASSKYVERPGTRRFLLADAALTGANGLAYVVLPGLLGDWFGISSGLLVGLGIFLLVVAAEIVFLATRDRIPRFGVTMLAEVNIVWVVASLVFAAVASLTTLGAVWVIAQALIVAAFAARQLMIARRPQPAP